MQGHFGKMEGNIGEMPEKGYINISDTRFTADAFLQFRACFFKKGLFVQDGISSYQEPGQQKESEYPAKYPYPVS